MGHDAGLCCQAGFPLWNVPLVHAVSVFSSLLCFIASLFNTSQFECATTQASEVTHNATTRTMHAGLCITSMHTGAQKAETSESLQN
jgi:hypothetical protein